MQKVGGEGGGKLIRVPSPKFWEAVGTAGHRARTLTGFRFSDAWIGPFLQFIPLLERMIRGVVRLSSIYIALY